jgi:endonuclease-3
VKFQGLDRTARALKIIKTLEQATKGMVEPASNQIIATFGRDPFLILISCILSLRTRDTVSLPASLRLFQIAKTPEQILEIPVSKLEQIIYPVGFYRTKAKNIHLICMDLIIQFNGTVPSTMDELLSFKGVGRKTANLTLSIGFGIPALCVDTHVHRISNRLGLVKTETPDQTEAELATFLPKEQWIEYSRLLVMWGQNICVPISPFCSKCPISDLCPKIDVTRKR